MHHSLITSLYGNALCVSPPARIDTHHSPPTYVCHRALYPLAHCLFLKPMKKNPFFSPNNYHPFSFVGLYLSFQSKLFILDTETKWLTNWLVRSANLYAPAAPPSPNTSSAALCAILSMRANPLPSLFSSLPLSRLVDERWLHLALCCRMPVHEAHSYTSPWWSVTAKHSCRNPQVFSSPTQFLQSFFPPPHPSSSLSFF